MKSFLFKYFSKNEPSTSQARRCLNLPPNSSDKAGWWQNKCLIWNHFKEAVYNYSPKTKYSGINTICDLKVSKAHQQFLMRSYNLLSSPESCFILPNTFLIFSFPGTNVQSKHNCIVGIFQNPVSFHYYKIESLHKGLLHLKLKFDMFGWELFSIILEKVLPQSLIAVIHHRSTLEMLLRFRLQKMDIISP